MDEIARCSVAIGYWNLRAEEARRQEEREARERAEREERERRLEAEMNGPLKLVDAWRKSRDIRSLVRAVARRAAENGISLEPGSHVPEWIALAMSHADRIDPSLAGAGRREAAR